MLSDSVKDDIVNFFRASDGNKDGCLSREEVGLIMARVKGQTPSIQEVDQCFRALDIDRNGSITEDEFCQVMMTWLQDVSNPQKKRRASEDILGSPSTLTRKRAVSEIANFFRQFSPIKNFQEEQMLILTKSRVDTDVVFMQREYVTMSPEEKSEKHQAIRAMVERSRSDIMRNLMALDWRSVMIGVATVNQILSIVELFSSSQERFDFSSIIITVFNKVTYYYKGDEWETSIIQRLCRLVAQDVPVEQQITLYTPCLVALRNYITGPGVACMQTVESGNPWHPAHALTKQVVHNQGLPRRIFDIIKTHSVVNIANCDLLRAAVLCIGAFAEDHVACLEIVLKMGLRRVLIDLLTGIMGDMGRFRDLARSIFGALSILVGHTHIFNTEERSNVPKEIALSESDLFHLLSASHRMMDMLVKTNEFDSIAVLNCSLVLKYTLPLVSSHDPLYLAIFESVMSLFKKPCAGESERLYATIAQDELLEEIVANSEAIGAKVWEGYSITQTLVEQMQYTSESCGTDLCRACIGVFRTLLRPNSIRYLVSSSNHVIITECMRLLSNVDCGMYAADFLSECMREPALQPTVKELGVVDGFFSLFFKFKQSVNILCEVLGVYVGPFYAIFTLKTITRALNEIATSPTSTDIFTPDHVDTIRQLHGVMCTELSSGRLVESEELHELCEDLLALMQSIIKAHVDGSSVFSESIVAENADLIEKWAQSLNSAAVDGFMARAETEICVVAYPQWPSDRAFGQLESEYTLIVPHTVTLDLLQSYYAALFQTSVLLNTKDEDGSLMPLISQAQLETRVRRSVVDEVNRNVVMVYLTLVGPGPAAADMLGLMPKELALRELQTHLALHNRRIHAQMMGDFYDLLKVSGRSEVSMEQFVSALTSPKFGFSQDDAIDMFRAFDCDGNNWLSLNEIALGFAMIADGSVDDRLVLMFQAFDLNKDKVLTMDELVAMLMAATGRPQSSCRAYAEKLRRRVDANGDGVIDFDEFRGAVYNNQIPLGALWSEGTVRSAIDRAYSQTPPRNRANIPAVDFSTRNHRNRHVYIPREFMIPGYTDITANATARNRSQTMSSGKHTHNRGGFTSSPRNRGQSMPEVNRGNQRGGRGGGRGQARHQPRR